MGEMLDLAAVCEGIDYAGDILPGQLIVVRDLYALVRGVDKERFVVRLAALQHHYAGGDRGAEEEVRGELYHAVDEVVVYEILPDLLLRAAAVHDAREADYRRRAVRREPREGVHYKRKVGLRFGCKHARGSKARIVYEQRVFIARPLD